MTPFDGSTQAKFDALMNALSMLVSGISKSGRWELPLVHAVCCHELGKDEEAARTYDTLLADPDVPENSKAVARENR